MTVPSRFFLCAKNMADYGTLTATSAVATLPVSNLQNSRRARTWRSSSAVLQELKLTWSGYNSERINFAMLNRHNLEPNARWYVQGYSTYDWTGTAIFDNSWVNYLPQSNNFATTWFQGGTGTEVQNVNGLGGELNVAWTLTDTDAAITTYWDQTLVTSAGVQIAFSVRIKKKVVLDVAPYVAVEFNSGGSPRAAIVIHPVTGAIVSAGNVGYETGTECISEPTDNDFWKATVVLTAPVGTTAVTVFVIPAFNTDASASGNVAATGSTVFTDAQVEVGALTHDVTRTTTVAVRSGPLCYSSPTLGSLDWGVAPLGSTGQLDSFIGQRYSVAYFLENTAVVNSLKVTLVDTGNSAGYLEASRLYTGKGTEFAYNPSTLACKWNEHTAQERMDGGSLASDGASSFREMVADISWVNEADRSVLMDMYRFAGKRLDLFASARPGLGGNSSEEERDHTGIWRFRDMDDLSTVMYQIWKARLQLTEV